MAWGKSTAETIKLFEEVLPRHPAIERRQMFGFPTVVANGNLFLGLHENRFLLRLSDEDRATLVRDFAAKVFEPMPGRASRHTLIVPEAIARDPERLRDWCDRALRHALTLPPKKAKAKAKGKAKATVKPKAKPARKKVAASAKRRRSR